MKYSSAESYLLFCILNAEHTTSSIVVKQVRDYTAALILKFKNICDALYQKWLGENVQLISNTRYKSALYTAYAK